jgi:hypothetical protein
MDEEYLEGLTIAELRVAFDLFLDRSVPTPPGALAEPMREAIWEAFMTSVREKCTVVRRPIGERFMALAEARQEIETLKQEKEGFLNDAVTRAATDYRYDRNPHNQSRLERAQQALSTFLTKQEIRPRPGPVCERLRVADEPDASERATGNGC